MAYAEILSRNAGTITATTTGAVRKGRFAELSYSGGLQVAEVNGAGDRADGVFAADAASGTTVEIITAGRVVKCVAGADTTPLSDVASDNQGRAIDHPGTVGHYIEGRFLGDAAAAGDEVDVLLTDPRPFITVA